MAGVLLTPFAGEGSESLEACRASGGWEALQTALTSMAPAEVTRRVADSRLLGRGGAAFPTARKWELAAAAEATPKYVVANGGEHEPGSRKDRLLVTRHPHKVLEGMALCAFATGASEGVLYLIEEMTDAIASARSAIEEARAAGFLGRGILGSTFSFDVGIVEAPPTYVAGEETAALEVIEGRPAKPRRKPPFPGESGLFGKPTTVNNVETLACVPGIIRHGAEWFHALGRRGGAGTMLFTLDDRVVNPGVHELPFGATFRELIEDAGGGTRSGRALRAILPAMSSAFLAASALDTPMTYEKVKAAGSGLGCGGVTFIEEGECVVERALDIAEFFKREQCGQCPACRMETNTLAAIVEQVRIGEAGDYGGQAGKIVEFAKGKGYCSLPAMAAAPVLSAMALFPGDFARHAEDGICPHQI